MSQSDRVVDQSGTEKDTGRAVNLNLKTLVGIVEERVTGPANVGQPKSTEARRWNLELWEGRSTSSLMEGTE